MAVTYKRDSEKLMGLSDDDKPTNVPVNTRFWELDTNDMYFFDGEEWHKIGYDAAE